MMFNRFDAWRSILFASALFGAVVLGFIWQGPTINRYLQGGTVTGDGVGAKVWQTWQVNGTPLRLEVVSDPNDLSQGLGDRDSLPKNQGMLFEMGREDIHPFWMRHMRFPLDILWIRNRQVVEIAPNMPAPGPFSVPVTHTPSETADEVLELNAGEAKAYGLEVGTRLPAR